MTIQELIDAGYKPTTSVYKEAGISRSTAYERLEAAGLRKEPHLIFTSPKRSWVSPEATNFLLDKNLRHFMPVAEVERMAGVGTGSVRKWVKTHGFKRGSQYKIVRRKAYIHDDLAWLYLDGEGGWPRVSEAPAGWRSVKWLMAETGLSRSHWHTALRSEPDLNAVQLRDLTVLIHPEDAEHLRLKALSLRPLAGWVPLAVIAEEANRHPSVIHKVVRERKLETRWFRREGRQPERMVGPADAEQLLEWSKSARRHRQAGRLALRASQEE